MKTQSIGFVTMMNQYRRIWPITFTNYSQVYLVHDTKERCHRVLKVIRKIDCSLPGPNEHGITEILNHRYIIKLVDSFEWNGYQILVFPKLDGSSLAKIDRCLPTDAVKIVYRILLAVNYLHKRSIIHGDISPNNIIVEKDCTPILIDFGTSELLLEGRQSTCDIGTSSFISPERKKRTSTFSSDVYSLGATLQYFIDQKSGIPIEMFNMIHNMMKTEPEKRPLISDCLKEEFFVRILGDEWIEKERVDEADLLLA